jgi:hypothetical protein
MDQWLVRTSSNRIEGPYSRDQVVELIRDGKLGPQDEVCQANQYWIFLHEQHEVQRQLGIQMPRSKSGKSAASGEEEITETQTETDTENQAPPPPSVPDDYDGSTAVISRLPAKPKSIPQAQARESSRAKPPAMSVAGTSVRGALERSSVWRGFVWVMVVAAGMLVYAVLKLLKTSG